MGSFQGFTPTKEGNDQKLTLHYWGRMAMISEMLPAMRSTPAPRVISVLSAGVHSPYAGFRADPELKAHYSVSNAANIAGLYNDLGLDALAVRPENSNVAFVHAAPGFVNTNWGTELPWYLRGMVRALQPLGRSPATCAEFMLDPVFRPLSELRESYSGGVPGVVLMGQDAQPAAKTTAHSAEARDAVWATTSDVLRRAGLSMER